MSTQTANGAVDLAFKKAVQEFKSKLKNDDLYEEIQKTTSIDHVYDLTDKLQQEQGKTGHLRHLSRIHNYLTRLNTYAAAIDTFVQLKPDILSLIWGPIKLVIQWASTLKKSQDAIVNTAEEIGDLLPDFKEMAEIFSDKTSLTEVLVLFFNDIMDFYLVTLRFFSMARKSFPTVLPSSSFFSYIIFATPQPNDFNLGFYRVAVFIRIPVASSNRKD